MSAPRLGPSAAALRSSRALKLADPMLSLLLYALVAIALVVAFASAVDSSISPAITAAFTRSLPGGATTPGPRLVFVIGIAVTVAQLILLRGMVRTARDGDPFAPVNVARLRWLAATSLLLVPLDLYLGVLAEPAAAWSEQLDWDQLFSVGAFYILSLIWRHGATMRQELEETV